MRRYSLISIILICIFLCGCQHTGNQNVVSSQEQKEIFFAMDTVMEFTVYSDDNEVLKKAMSLTKELENKFSVTLENSEINQLNVAGRNMLSDDTLSLLKDALELCQETNGALDISVYPILKLWGFTTDDYCVPDQSEIQQQLEYVDYEKIHIDFNSNEVSLADGMQIDLGSVAKGYTGERLAQMLKEKGVTSGLLNLGGNVQTIGTKPDGSFWRVGIQDPLTDEYMAVVEVSDKAVVTSGGYERYFEENGQTYWHILNPDTGCPAQSGLISVTIIGDSGTMCDGLSTALFVMGVDAASNFWREHGGFEAVFVTADNRLYMTEGLEECLTLTDDAANKYTVEVIR